MQRSASTFFILSWLSDHKVHFGGEKAVFAGQGQAAVILFGDLAHRIEPDAVGKAILLRGQDDIILYLDVLANGIGDLDKEHIRPLLCGDRNDLLLLDRHFDAGLCRVVQRVSENYAQVDGIHYVHGDETLELNLDVVLPCPVDLVRDKRVHKRIAAVNLDVVLLSKLGKPRQVGSCFVQIAVLEAGVKSDEHIVEVVPELSQVFVGLAHLLIVTHLLMHLLFHRGIYLFVV